MSHKNHFTKDLAYHRGKDSIMVRSEKLPFLLYTSIAVTLSLIYVCFLHKFNTHIYNFTLLYTDTNSPTGPIVESILRDVPLIGMLYADSIISS